MPYITQADRISAEYLTALTPGMLNYQLTTLCVEYWKDADKQSYQTINDIIGALEACKLEFYRRVVVPYEDKKIQENGDVY